MMRYQSKGMDQRAITEYIAATFAGVDVVIGEEGIAAGDTFFIYDPERNLDDKHKIPFATIVTKDYGDFDRASNLDRPGVFLLNVGVGGERYRSLFGPPPAKPEPNGVVQTGHDFAALDQLLPHPFYATQSWVCVLNPSDETFERVKPLLDEAYRLAARRHPRKKPPGSA